ncbi:MAG TPA: AfsA-related hotdog domain-containing protein [Spirochaetota bacterium]|nr:AfsA-related hotdog domain-containing protein [Spirochaetota bacterium]
MSNRKFKLIDKKFVHKYKDENVLVYNVRRALPRKIDKDFFDEVIRPSITNEEKKRLLLNSYSSEKFLFLLDKKPNSTPYYLLHSLPREIDINLAKDFVKLLDISDKNQKKLLKYFTLDKERRLFILTDNLTENEEHEVLKIINMKDWHLTDYDKTILSSIFEEFDDEKLAKEDIFYCNLYADTNHEFFFEHPNEHVPGIMLIEAVRQFSIACCHQFGHVPFEGVSFLLSEMQSKFNSFLDVNYPVLFKCINKSQIKKRVGYWVDVDMNIIVYQKHKEMANFSIIAKCVNKDTFKIFRSEPVKYDAAPRFFPLKHFYHNINIIGSNKKKYICDIVDISDTGFRVKFKKQCFEESESFFDFYIFFQDIGIIQGTCDLIWTHINDKKEQHAGFKISTIEDMDRESMKEAIKTMCYIKEEREIV